MKKGNSFFPYKKALSKAMRYCSFQERCIQDMKLRFNDWNVNPTDYDKLIDQLFLDNFLNEQRFIEDYVRGKFRMKKWGKNKIKNGLITKNIKNDKLISLAFSTEIADDEYLETIAYLIDRKKELLTETDKFKTQNKIYRYMVGKGFESDLITNHLNNQII